MQQSIWECLGTWVAIAGISWSITTMCRIALRFLDRSHRWF